MHPIKIGQDTEQNAPKGAGIFKVPTDLIQDKSRIFYYIKVKICHKKQNDKWKNLKYIISVMDQFIFNIYRHDL